MKISFFMPFAALFTAVTFLSCGNLAIPESVSLKIEDADYSLPLGGASVRIADKLNAKTVQKALGGDDEEDKNTAEEDNADGDSSDMTVYEFNPTKKDDAITEFLVNYDIKETKLSFNDLPEILDDTAIEAFLTTLGITPEGDGSVRIPLNNFNAKLDTGINFQGAVNSLSSSDDEDENSANPDKKDYGKLIFDRIAFSNIKAFAYIKMNGIPENTLAEFKGQIYVQNDKDSPTQKYKISDSDEKDSKYFQNINELPDLEKFDEMDGNADCVIEDDSFLQNDKYSTDLNVESDTGETNLTKFINGIENEKGELEKFDKCIITYDLIPSLRFESKDALISFLKNQKELSVNVNIILRFPARLKVISDIVIDDILAVAGSSFEDDLLNRGEGEESKTSKYVDIVDSMGFDYKLDNTTGLIFKASMVSNEVDGEKLFEDKELKFDSEKDGVEFSKSEIKSILEKAPFKPKIEFVIFKTNEEENKGFIEIKRNSVFGIWGIFKARLNGKIELWNKNDSGESNE